jgi:hypothetical protein
VIVWTTLASATPIVLPLVAYTTTSPPSTPICTRHCSHPSPTIARDGGRCHHHPRPTRHAASVLLKPKKDQTVEQRAKTKKRASRRDKAKERVNPKPSLVEKWSRTHPSPQGQGQGWRHHRTRRRSCCYHAQARGAPLPWSNQASLPALLWQARSCLWAHVRLFNFGHHLHWRSHLAASTMSVCYLGSVFLVPHWKCMCPHVWFW